MHPSAKNCFVRHIICCPDPDKVGGAFDFGMHPSVKANFVNIQKKFEGFTNWMYMDEKCLVTTGVGNLIDPLDNRTFSLDWQVNGRKATHAEIEQAWNTVKSHTELCKKGGGAYKNLTNLRLSNEGVKQLVGRVADSFDKTLAKRFAGWDHWPADGQLGGLLISWAYGPNFKSGFPGFETAANKLVPDFPKMKSIADAAFKREVARGNKGVEPRRIATNLAFDNAHKVMKGKGRITTLHYPKKATWATPTTIGLGILVAGGAYYLYDSASFEGTIKRLTTKINKARKAS